MRENVTNGKADNHEGIDFYRPVENPDKSKPLWGENQWPSVPSYKEKYESWIEKMKTLGMLVMEACVQTLTQIMTSTLIFLGQHGDWSRNGNRRVGTPEGSGRR